MNWTIIGAICLAVLVVIGVLQSVRFRVYHHIAGRARLSEDEFATKFFPAEQKSIATKVRQLVAPYLPLNEGFIHPSDKLVDDLGLSARLSAGLDLVSFVQDIEDEFKLEFDEEDYYRVQTFRDVVIIIEEKSRAHGAKQAGSTGEG